MIFKTAENLKDINWLVREKLSMHLKESRIKSKSVEVHENYESKCHAMAEKAQLKII